MADDRDADWAALMRAGQDGDRVAYRRLLSEISPYLRAICRRSLRHSEDAEDVVQEILISLHAARHSYDPVRPFRPWLLSITRARIIDRVRRRGRLAARETGLEARHETYADPATNPESARWDPGDWDGRALQEAIAALPPGQMQAIRLLKLQEMSLQEASAMTGQSVTALKVATHRAIARLRVLLAGRE